MNNNQRPAITAHLTQIPGHGLRGVKNVIAIGSGKGGVGKSTVTVNLAIALAQQGARVGVLDADIYGPSVPIMLGQVDPVICENDRYVPITAHGIQAMSMGYLTNDTNSTLIWRGPMLSKALLQMLDITQWQDLDYLLIDLPPGTGDIQLSLVQKIPLAGAIVVTTPQTVATQDADKALNLFEKTNIHVLGVIENMGYYQCMHCGEPNHVFGQDGAEALCQKHGCTHLGTLPLDAQISQDGDNGTPSARAQTEPSPIHAAFKQIAHNVQQALSLRPVNYAHKMPPVVVK